jgi:hypothetical protein
MLYWAMIEVTSIEQCAAIRFASLIITYGKALLVAMPLGIVMTLVIAHANGRCRR